MRSDDVEAVLETLVSLHEAQSAHDVDAVLAAYAIDGYANLAGLRAYNEQLMEADAFRGREVDLAHARDRGTGRRTPWRALDRRRGPFTRRRCSGRAVGPDRALHKSGQGGQSRSITMGTWPPGTASAISHMSPTNAAMVAAYHVPDTDMP